MSTEKYVVPSAPRGVQSSKKKYCQEIKISFRWQFMSKLYDKQHIILYHNSEHHNVHRRQNLRTQPLLISFEI